MKGYILAIEVGGTYIRTGVSIQKSGQNILYGKKRFLNIGNAIMEIERNIVEPINRLLYENKEEKLLGIGVSLAAILDRKNGRIKTWPNHSLCNGFPISEYLVNKFHVPIFIEDDANCGLLGEYTVLETKKITHLAYICIGTGVGCGLMLNKTLYTGENGFAGELGHTCIFSYNTTCTFGNSGCLQSIVSGPAILKKYNYITKKNHLDLETLSVKTDSTLRQCYEETITCLSKSIYNISMLLDISNFIIGGGVVKMHEDFIKDIQMNANLYIHPFERKLYITGAKLGELAGITGAIYLVKNMLKI